MKLALLVAFGASLGLAQETTLPKDLPPVDPAMASDVRRLLEDVGFKQIMAQVFDQTVSPMLDSMFKTQSQFTPEFTKEFTRRIRADMLDGRLEDMMAREYAKKFTRDEVKQMLAYQESPVGRKAAQLTPQMMMDFQGQMRPYGEQEGMRIGREILKEHPEYLRKPFTQTESSANQTTSQPGIHRISGRVQQVKLISRVPPVYPPDAKTARIQGAVTFKAILDTAGKVKNVELVSGPPLLIDAARDAVVQWTYEPMLLDGKPVEVVTDIVVNFNLTP